MFTIDHRQVKSIRMKQVLNSILGDIGEETPISSEVSLVRHHGHKLIAIYGDQEMEVSTKHIEMGFWCVYEGTDTAKSRVLDALNTLA